MNFSRMFVLLMIAAVVALGLWLPAGAAPGAQQYSTPTAQADGRILYIIQGGDTCIRIALLNGITVEQLRELNSKIDAGCTNLIAGQELLLGLVGPAAATNTPGPSPTAAPPTVTATPFSGTTEICVLLFNDLNGDALRQETEPAIADGAVSVTEISGKYSAALNTVIVADPEAYQGICFADVPEGSYNISVAIPDLYNPTVDPTYKLDVKAGDLSFVAFGAQSTEGIQEPEDPSTRGGGGTSGLLGIFGLVLLLGGAGLGWYAWQSGRPSQKLGLRKDILKR